MVGALRSRHETHLRSGDAARLQRGRPSDLRRHGGGGHAWTLLLTGTTEDSDDAAKILVADLILLLAMTDIATLLPRGRRG